MLNLQGGASDQARAEDRRALNSLFAFIREREFDCPQCDALLVYCTVNPDGQMKGTQNTLAQLVSISGARIVVVASDNPASNYGARFIGKELAINLVLTVDRRGTYFSIFFERLFRLMKSGESMSQAWVQLAPQVPGMAHAACPACMFMCGAENARLKW